MHFALVIVLLLICTLATGQILRVERSGDEFNFVATLDDASQDLPEFINPKDASACETLEWKRTEKEYRARVSLQALISCVQDESLSESHTRGVFGTSPFELTSLPNSFFMLCSSKLNNIDAWNSLQITRQGAVATITLVSNAGVKEFSGMHSRFGALKFIQATSDDKFYKANIVLQSRPLIMEDDSMFVVIDSPVMCQMFQILKDGNSFESEETPLQTETVEPTQEAVPSSSEALEVISPLLTKNSLETQTMVITTSGCVKLLDDNVDVTNEETNTHTVVRFESVDVCYQIGRVGSCLPLLYENGCLLRKATMTDPQAPDGTPFFSTKDKPFLAHNNEYDLCIVDLKERVDSLLTLYPITEHKVGRKLKKSLSKLDLSEINDNAIEKELFESATFQIQLGYYIVNLTVDQHRLSGGSFLRARIPIVKREGGGYTLGEVIKDSDVKIHNARGEVELSHEEHYYVVPADGFPRWLSLCLFMTFCIVVLSIFIYYGFCSQPQTNRDIVVSSVHAHNTKSSSSSTRRNAAGDRK